MRYPQHWTYGNLYLGQMGEVYPDGVGDLGHLGLCVLPGS